MTRKRVTLLRGGPSNEHDVSMRSGAAVLTALAPTGYTVTDVTITITGKWLVHGIEKSPRDVLLATDVVFIALHGSYGEDGTVQRLCEYFNVPFTGSGSFASGLAFNKDTTKRLLVDHEITLPRHVTMRKGVSNLEDRINIVAKTFGPEYVIKPLKSGSSYGTLMASGKEDLLSKLASLLDEFEECMVEERIIGREATCGVLNDFRGAPVYTLPPVEIIPPPTAAFFDSSVKYSGETEEICPGRFSYEEQEMIMQAARIAHVALNLDQYSRSDFIIKDGKVYFLEVNTLPGLTTESLFPKAVEAVGLGFPDLVRHLIETAKVR